jgi:hypothetical protein
LSAPGFDFQFQLAPIEPSSSCRLIFLIQLQFWTLSFERLFLGQGERMVIGNQTRLLDCFCAGHRKAEAFIVAWFARLKILGEDFIKHLVIN